MKIFIAKILVENTDLNSCSAHPFRSLEQARKFADKEIDNYAMDYDGNVIERSPNKYQMQSGDQYVTIEIETHTI